MTLKTFTIADIRSWNHCYDFAKHLPEDWSGTALDILRLDKVSPEDKFWVVCREELIDAKTLRLFAVWCARQVPEIMTDYRSVALLDVAERFAQGLATTEELTTARFAKDGWLARAAAWATTRADAGYAAIDAAFYAARSTVAANAQIQKLITMLEELRS